MNIKKFSENRLLIFCIILGGLLCISWGWIIYHHGTGLDNYFVGYAFFSDLYSPMQKELTNTYGEPFHSNYPPFANITFYVLRCFIKIENLVSYDGIVNSFGAVIILLGYSIFSILFLYLSMKSLACNENSKYKNDGFIVTCFCLEILLSGPVLFLFARGNNLIFAIILILFFTAFYESDNYLLREMSVIALALATALKIYPVFFGILLLKKENVKLVFRTIVYGIIFMFVPFAFYGKNAIVLFLQNIVGRNSSEYYLNHVIGFKGAIQIFGTVFQKNPIVNFSPWFMLIPLAVCLLIYFITEKKWVKFFAICLWIIWFPAGSYLYNFVLLLVPLIMFLTEEKDKNTILTYIYILLFALIFTPTFWGKINSANEILEPLGMGNITWNMLFINIAFFVLVVVVLLENLGIKGLKKISGKRKEKKYKWLL